MASARGLLVVFEGIDGTGKSTQVEALAAWARGRGWTVVTSAEPTRGPHGMALRRSMTEGRLSVEEELELFCLDRAEHVERLIEPALSRGELVILDRYYLSTAAYQGARGLDPDAIIARNEAFAPRPDVLIWLQLDPALAGARIRGRGETNEFEREESLRQVAALFARVLAARPVVAVDASQSPDAVHAEIVAALEGGAHGARFAS